MTKTEAALIIRAQFQVRNITGTDGFVALLNKREVSAGRSLVAAGLCEFRYGQDNGKPSEYFDAIRWYAV